MFRDHYNIPLVHVDASETFLGALAGVSDPEVKRKTIGGSSSTCSRPKPRRSAAPIPGAGHALPGRDRERVAQRRALGDDQVPPQRRRPARAHEHEARRAAARTVQGRGARARSQRSACRPPSSAAIRFPGRASRSASLATVTPRDARHPAPGGRDLSRRDPRRPVSTTRSGRPSPCCCRCAPSASWATGAPTIRSAPCAP